MLIKTTKEASVNRIKMLIAGESGAGKTTLAKTIDENVLIVSSEAGLLCLQDCDPPIDVIDLTLDDAGKLLPKGQRIKKLGDVYSYLQTEEATKKYQWIFIDSLTEISQNLIEALYEEFPERRDSLVMYGENAKRMRAIIKSFRDLPHYNVVFTALPTQERDENNKRFTTVNMVGKIAQQLPAFFDEVFYLETTQQDEKVIRYLITEKSDNLIAKDRSGKLDRIEPANIGHIVKKIKGEL